MSDEEIAEQYAEVNKCVYQNTFVDYSDDYEELKQAVLYGLAKGKEDLEKVKTEKYFYKKDTQELEKENAALKETLKWIDNNCMNGINTFNEHGLNAGQVVTILQDIHATILEKGVVNDSSRTS